MIRTGKLSAAAGISILLVVGAAGCGSGSAEGTEIQVTSMEKMQEDSQKDDTSLHVESKDSLEENKEKDDLPEGKRKSDGEPLSGKIQQLDESGMIIAQTTVWDDGEGGSGTITLVDEKDAEKIPVRFAGDVKVEYWKIQGGGAGIDMQDCTLSNLSAGIMVEMEGYYEGEEYVATRIIMEEYV